MLITEDNYNNIDPIDIDINNINNDVDISKINNSNDPPVVNFVNRILYDAIVMNASDVHIEPYEDNVRIRYRINGQLLEQSFLPIKYKNNIISRLKIMSQLDISETRIAQDGRMKLKLNDKSIDIRLSSMATIFGEKIVMRILNKDNLQLDMLKLGFTEAQQLVINNALHEPFGMILVTGPTGSGKTTTLYSMLHNINTANVNISTAENPVEYNIKGINQIQINEEIGITFTSALRTLLRQDPDIIMIGEIRDKDTAEIAINAALTGHIVLSTLHTNNAIATISRLLKMGIESYLTANAINLIIAQRLIRKLCPYCKVKETNLTIIEKYNLDIMKPIYKNIGCKQCNNTGYSGRIAIYEVLPITKVIIKCIYNNADSMEIEDIAVKNGLIRLRDNVINLLYNGETSINEAIQYIKKEQ
jgi:type IV pilus assembly protein PilB